MNDRQAIEGPWAWQLSELESCWDLAQYRHFRDGYVAYLVAHKRERRVRLGDLSILFESPETVRGQIFELLHAAREERGHAIAAAIEEYRPLVAQPGHGVATVMVDSSHVPTLLALADEVRLECPLALCSGASRSNGRVLEPAGPSAVYTVAFDLRGRETTGAWHLQGPAGSVDLSSALSAELTLAAS